MSISFACDACGKSYKVDEKLSGKKAKCSCGRSLIVPTREPEPLLDPFSNLGEDDLFAAPLDPVAVPPARPLAPVPVSRPAPRSSAPRSSALRKKLQFDPKWLVVGGGGILGSVLVAGLVWAILAGVRGMSSGRPDAKTFRGEFGEARTTAEWLEIVRQQQTGQSSNVLSRRTTSGIERWLAPDPAAVPDLFAALANDQPGSRSYQLAQSVLRRFDREQVQPLLSDLEQGLDHEHPEVRLWSARLLRLHGTNAKPLLPRIAPLLQDSDPKLVAVAARTLCEMGDEGLKQVLDRFQSLNGQQELQGSLLLTLAEVTGEIKPAVPVAVSLLTQRVHEGLVLNCLKKWGNRAADAVPSLVTLLEKETDRARRDQLSGALVAIQTGVAQAISPLIQSQIDENRIDGLSILNALGDVSTVRSNLDEFLQSTDERLAQQALAAVGKLGAEGKPYLPRVTSLLNSANSTLASAALQTIGGLGVHANEVTPQLLKLFKDPMARVDRGLLQQALTPLCDLPERTPVELAELVRWSDDELSQKCVARLKQLPASSQPEAVQLLTEAKQRFEAEIAAWELQHEEASRAEVLVFRDRLGMNREMVYRPPSRRDIASGGAFLTREEFITRQQVVAGMEGPIESRRYEVPPLADSVRNAPTVIAGLIDKFK